MNVKISEDYDIKFYNTKEKCEMIINNNFNRALFNKQQKTNICDENRVLR